MGSTIATRIPDDILEEIEFLVDEKKTDKAKIVRELLSEGVKEELKRLALEKYREKKVTLAKAASIAKIPLADFVKAAADQGIPMNYSEESLKKDFKAAMK